MNKETGKLQEKSYGQRIAFRPKTVDTAIEGPFIYYHPETDYYYLFVSFDSLNDSYNIRVARAKEITGPYLDWHGTAMTDQEKTPTEVGTKLLGSYQFSEETVVYAPGHNSIFTQSNKESFVVHHARRKPFSDQFHLQIRKLYWLESGWPVISASIYQGSVSRMPEQETLLGKWEIIQFDYESQIISSQQHEITELKKKDEVTCGKEMNLSHIMSTSTKKKGCFSLESMIRALRFLVEKCAKNKKQAAQ